MPIERLAALFGACALLWAVECRWPLVAFGGDRVRHMLPNLVLASLTILVNLGFATALSPARLDVQPWNDAWPLWLQVAAGVDRVLRWVLVTPNMHKWHHSRDARETDTNYGNILSTWDRLFGTFTGRAQHAPPRYGLDGFDGSDSQSLGGLLLMPIAK